MTPQDLKQISNLFDKKFDNIDKKFDNIDKKFDNIDKKFDNIDKRFDKVDKNITELKTDVDFLKYKVGENEKAIQKIDGNISKWKSDMFDALDKFMLETSDQREFRTVGGYQLSSNTKRIGTLETKVFGTITGA